MSILELRQPKSKIPIGNSKSRKSATINDSLFARLAALSSHVWKTTWSKQTFRAFSCSCVKHTSTHQTINKSSHEDCFKSNLLSQTLLNKNDLTTCENYELKQRSLNSLLGTNKGFDTEEHDGLNDEVSISTPPLRVTRSEIFGEDPPTPSASSQKLMMVEKIIHMTHAENVYFGIVGSDIPIMSCDQSEISEGTYSSFSSNDIPEVIEIQLDCQQKINLPCFQRCSL